MTIGKFRIHREGYKIIAGVLIALVAINITAWQIWNGPTPWHWAGLAASLMLLAFVVMFFRFQGLNRMREADGEWVKRAKEMVNGDDHNMPEMGKYNGGQKLLFWFLGVAMLVLFVSGIVIWRAYFSASFPIGVVRLGALLHAAFAALMIAAIIIHVYAAIWVRGTIRAMLYGTVTRAWAKQHHRAWYKQMTGK